jgi:hypothetical protein
LVPRHAIKLRIGIVSTAPGKSKVSPLTYYYLGYFAERLNQSDKAAEYYRLAAKAPTDYVFPFQMELIVVLEDAMRVNPTDSHATYYLGNLLFDWQPARATALWEKSVSLGADFRLSTATSLSFIRLREISVKRPLFPWRKQPLSVVMPWFSMISISYMKKTAFHPSSD